MEINVRNRETWQSLLLVLSLVGVMYGIYVNRKAHKKYDKEQETQNRMDELLRTNQEILRQFAVRGFNTTGIVVT